MELLLPKIVINLVGTSTYTQQNVDDRLAALTDRDDDEAVRERTFLLSLPRKD